MIRLPIHKRPYTTTWLTEAVFHVSKPVKTNAQKVMTLKTMNNFMKEKSEGEINSWSIPKEKEKRET
jgi:hypothetical protein